MLVLNLYCLEKLTKHRLWHRIYQATNYFFLKVPELITYSTEGYNFQTYPPVDALQMRNGNGTQSYPSIKCNTDIIEIIYNKKYLNLKFKPLLIVHKVQGLERTS